MKPLFILGMGAHKTGTSWLHKTLSKEDHVNLGFMKEYHIWDYLFSDLGKGFEAPLKKPDNAGAAMRRLMQESSEIYTKYFQNLISSNVYVTGDITPSYSVINQRGLEKISDIIKGAGFNIKVIYLMRDPIDRIWSAVRAEKRRKLSNGHVVGDTFCELRAKEYICIKGQIARADYKSTIQNIKGVFDHDEILIDTYENLFNRRNTSRLQDFLGFTLKHVNFSERVNASNEEPMSQELVEHFFNFLAPQYEFCRINFRETNELWRNFR